LMYLHLLDSPSTPIITKYGTVSMTGTIPVTPDITSMAIKILLPVPGIEAPPLPRAPAQPLITRLTTPLAAWADNLWFHIRPHAHTDTLRSALLANLPIKLVSDAAVHPNGTGTCAWVIWAGAEVWSGEGYVPGTIQDMYSGLAEAYGIYTVLSFFLQYLYHYPLVPQRRRPINVYCDNKGLIDRICNCSATLYPRDAIRDDYPIYAEIDQCLHQLKPHELRFIHVLGHQDTKSNKQLTIPERLNIDCDARAANLPAFDDPTQLQTTPSLDASYPHIRINGQILIRRLQVTLRDAATQDTYFQYLQDKFQWTNLPTVSIQWQVIQLAFRRFNRTERKTLTKFIHEWLPLQDRYQVHSASSDHSCPSCHSAPETMAHFLSCPHPNHQAIWTELDDQILQYFLHHQIKSTYHELFQYGLILS